MLAKLINTLGGIENPFDWMASGMAHAQPAIRQTNMLSPLSKCHGLTIMSQAYVVALVVCLYLSAGPLAILLAVMPLIVTTLKGHAFGSWPHVSVEVLKPEPSFAYLDSSRSVVSETSDIGIAASAEHRVPKIVNRRTAHAVSSGSISSRVSAAKAAAGLGIAVSEPCSNNLGFVSTVTLTEPLGRSPPTARDSANSNQSAKSLSRKIDDFHALKYPQSMGVNQAETAT